MKKQKRKNPRPSLRAKKAVALMGENGGNVSKALRDAGYGPGYADHPEKFTATQTFKELAEQMLPDDLLLQKHREGLEAVDTQSLIVGYKPQGKGKKSVPIVEIRNDPDFNVRHRYLETAYKIRGKIKDQTNVVVPMQVNVAQDRNKYS